MPTNSPISVENDVLILGQKPEKIDHSRENVRVILFDPKTGKYGICHTKGYSTLGGGVEQDESLLETVKRELVEETGYTDFEIVAKLGNKVIIYFKDDGLQKERISTGFLVVLNSDTNIGVNLTEEEKDEEHECVWLEAEDALQKIQETCGSDWEYHLEMFKRGVAKVEELELNKVLKSNS